MKGAGSPRGIWHIDPIRAGRSERDASRERWPHVKRFVDYGIG